MMKGRWAALLFLPLIAVLLTLAPRLLSAAGGRELASSGGYLPTPQPSEPCDLCEPNNSLSQSCGPLAPDSDYAYFVRCTGGLDDDLYYIDLDRPVTVTLDLTGIPSGTDYSIYLYDADKNLLCYSHQSGNADEHAVCNVSQAGRYYVRVYPWTGCSDDEPYTLAVDYPTPWPAPIPSCTPSPPCNRHIDDFRDTNSDNDLGHPSGWEVDPPGCGVFTATHTGFELRLSYDLPPGGGCTARYTTELSLSASPYDMLTFEIKGQAQEALTRTVIGLRDEVGHESRARVGDVLGQVLADTWQGVDVPLAALATGVDTTQLDTLFVESTGVGGAGPADVYLDSLRLEKPLAPLTVDNYDDRAGPNALGGWPGSASEGAAIETAYTGDGTCGDSPASYMISYTVPSGGWALWETGLTGLDASDYAYLTFYVKGAAGDEKPNLYLQDGQERLAYVDVEDYVPGGAVKTGWTPVRVPLQAFDGVALTDLAKVKFTFEWGAMAGMIFLDDLRFVADALLVDDFCDGDENNSLNGEMGTFTSAPSCAASVAPAFSSGRMRVDYDVSAGPGCFSGYYSRTTLDLNPYRTLAAQVRGERCGEVAAISARTVTVGTDKLKVGDFLLDGITDRWQEVRIPLAASTVVTDWARGDSYVVAFEAGQGASQGTVWWDDVAFETAGAPLWVDNFNDESEDPLNALRGASGIFKSEAEMSSAASLIQGYGDAGAGLALAYDIPVDEYAGWETDLRGVDLSNYERLVFDVKNSAGGAWPNVYLKDVDGQRGFVNLEDYVAPSNEWQFAAIGLRHFGDVDLTRVQHLQFIIEWEPTDVQGTLVLDNIRFTPIADFSPASENQVNLPMVARGYTPPDLDAIWEFESGAEGWTHQTYSDSQAVVAVEHSSFRSRGGSASLAMVVDLLGGDANKGQGETFVDMAVEPPAGVSVPVDLACKPVSCWVYVPTCGLGDLAAPNLVQLLVKDENGKSEYGTPVEVVRNQWFEVGLRPSTLVPVGGYKDAGFDPGRIRYLGVRFRAGSDGVAYQGKVYVDTCGWEEIDPAAQCYGAEP